MNSKFRKLLRYCNIIQCGLMYSEWLTYDYMLPVENIIEDQMCFNTRQTRQYCSEQSFCITCQLYVSIDHKERTKYRLVRHSSDEFITWYNITKLVGATNLSTYISNG